MALPDISFTNNVGTVAFKRAMIDVSDDWQWDGRAVTHRKRISVDAWITRDASEQLEGVVTRFDGSPATGAMGDLTLPWTVLHKIKLESLEQSTGTWQEYCHVQATFLDDLPQNNLYMVHLFGLELHNPRLSLPIPAKPTYDAYAQIISNNSGSVNPHNPFYGPIRFRMGYGMMQIGISGSLLFQDGLLPPDLLGILQQRQGVTTDTSFDLASLPDGYPIVFKLGEAIPELANDLAMSVCFVSGGRVQWDVEKQVARIQLQLLTQPQAWTEG